MKQLAHLLLAVLLVALVAGCGGMHHYDGRLTAADSLMMPNPDSALALVTAIPDSALTTEGDRAYRDLLMTQARYKCYVEITTSDDSAICRAMDYYRCHDGERDKLTRAYLYKGAVMEELGHVDSAMYYYKTAEAAADEKDYANLGQINTRIAALYRLYYADTQICYDNYSKALECYRHTGDKPKQLICLFNMAGLSGITMNNKDAAEKLLKQALMLAVELNDSANYYLCQELLCRQLSFEGKSVARAKQIAMHCLNDYRDYVNHDLILDLADIYVCCEMPDSARYYLDMVTENAGIDNLEQVKTRKYLILSDISKLEGDTALSSHYDMLSHQVSDSISNDKVKYQIQQIENTFIHRQHTNYLSQISHLQWIMMGLSLTAVIVIVLLTIAYLRRIRNTKAIIKELENYNLTHTNDLLNQFDAKNKAIGHLINNLVNILKACVSDKENKRSISQLAYQIKESIVDVADDDFWNELRTYLDNEHNNVISKIAGYPNLTKHELKFIELCCCGFSYLEMAIILDYSPRYVINKRNLIAKKMGLHMPLLDYLNEQMKDKGE